MPKRKQQDQIEVEEALQDSPKRRDNVSGSHGVIEKNILINPGTVY